MNFAELSDSSSENKSAIDLWIKYLQRSQTVGDNPYSRILTTFFAEDFCPPQYPLVI